MKVQDESLYQLQVEDLLNETTGAGKQFLKFFEFWVDSSEDVLLNHPDKTPLAALRVSLPMVETRLGEVTLPALGSLLTLAIAHWARGDEVVAELSSIEMKLVTEVMALKLAEWQDSAQAGDI